MDGSTVPTPDRGTSKHCDRLAEAKQAVADASGEIRRIDADMDRLGLAKAQATARFNFACARMVELQAKLQDKEATA